MRARAAARPGGAQARTDPGGGGDAAGAVAVFGKGRAWRSGGGVALREVRRGETRRDETRQDGGPRRERPAGPVQVLTRRQVPGPTAADPHLWSAARRVQCGVPGVWGGVRAALPARGRGGGEAILKGWRRGGSSGPGAP